MLKDEASQKVVIRPDVLEVLRKSVSGSSKFMFITIEEKNGKAWAMIKAKTKTRVLPRKRKLYEITGHDLEVKVSGKHVRVDQQEEESKYAADGSHFFTESKMEEGTKLTFSPKSIASIHPTILASNFKKLDK
jgi:hypothetical protein